MDESIGKLRTRTLVWLSFAFAGAGAGLLHETVPLAGAGFVAFSPFLATLSLSVYFVLAVLGSGLLWHPLGWLRLETHWTDLAAALGLVVAGYFFSELGGGFLQLAGGWLFALFPDAGTGGAVSAVVRFLVVAGEAAALLALKAWFVLRAVRRGTDREPSHPVAGLMVTTGCAVSLRLLSTYVVPLGWLWTDELLLGALLGYWLATAPRAPRAEPVLTLRPE